jgi:hypothetical protein
MSSRRSRARKLRAWTRYAMRYPRTTQTTMNLGPTRVFWPDRGAVLIANRDRRRRKHELEFWGRTKELERRRQQDALFS